VRFVFLEADRAELAKRLTSRAGHFAGISILDSQLATLEEPFAEEALTFDATLPPERIVAEIRKEFGL
jgi:gluconokinase